MSAVTDKPARRSALPTWIVATVAGLFGLFYAYVVWNAVTLLVSQATGPLGLNLTGWLVLGFAILFPILVFAVAFAIGWKRRLGPLLLLMLTGLALVAVFWLNVVAYAYAYGASMLG